MDDKYDNIILDYYARDMRRFCVCDTVISWVKLHTYLTFFWFKKQNKTKNKNKKRWVFFH